MKTEVSRLGDLSPNEASCDILAALCHDLRTPLSVTRACTEILLVKTNDPQIQSVWGPKLLASVNRLEAMIREVLTRYREESSSHQAVSEPWNLATTAREAIEGLSLVYGDRFVLECDSETLGNWDAPFILKVIENLACNAVKYGNPSSPVVIVLKQTEKAVRIAVENQGPALTPEEQSAIFNQFYRTKPAESSGHEGWGLGLALVREMVTSRAGAIRVESTTEKTSFIVELPRGA
jgi:signal transduction histidine kinase